MQIKLKVSVLLLGLFSLTRLCFADSNTDAQKDNLSCPNAHVLEKAVSKVCWKCIFPMYVSGVRLNNSSDSKNEIDSLGNSLSFHNAGVPSGAYTKPLCSCKNGEVYTPGIMQSMWEPARIAEFPHQSGCFSTLGGIDMSSTFDLMDRGRTGNMSALNTGNINNKGLEFRHYHEYAIPLLQMFNMMSSAICVKDNYSDLDLLQMSEVNPLWHDTGLSIFTNPESLVVVSMNVFAELACLPETATTLANNSPIESLFWCAGGWGQYYPLVGEVSGVGQNYGASLMEVRMLASFHRAGMEWDTIGERNSCSAKISMRLPKQQYKTQIISPRVENGTHVFGFPFLAWDRGMQYPTGAGEIPIMLIFRWNDCCNTQFVADAL